MNMQLIIISIISIILIVSITTGILVGRFISKTTKEFLSQKQVTIDSDIINSKIRATDVIDVLVAEALNNYIIFHSEVQSAEYINNETQEKIVRDVSVIVIERMSTHIYEYITIFINPDKVIDLINERSILAVMNFAIDKNSYVSK